MRKYLVPVEGWREALNMPMVFAFPFIWMFACVTGTWFGLALSLTMFASTLWAIGIAFLPEEKSG